MQQYCNDPVVEAFLGTSTKIMTFQSFNSQKSSLPDDGSSRDNEPLALSRRQLSHGRWSLWADTGHDVVSLKRVGSRYVSGRTRAWLKTKNPNFERR
jgi:hypothetical protein